MKRKSFYGKVAITLVALMITLGACSGGDGGDDNSTTNNNTNNYYDGGGNNDDGGDDNNTCTAGDRDYDNVCDNVDPCIGTENPDGSCDCLMDQDQDGVCEPYPDDCIDVDGDGLCDTADDCLDYDLDGVCDEGDCVYDMDFDGVCDATDSCVDVNGDTECDDGGLIVVVCWDFKDEYTFPMEEDDEGNWHYLPGDPIQEPDGIHDCRFAQASYENPNDEGSGNNWHAIRDEEVGASRCAILNPPVGYPDLILGAHYDSTRRPTNAEGAFDDDYDPTTGDFYTDWCNDPPKSITVGEIFYKNDYDMMDYEQGAGFWACHTFDGDCPEILPPPTTQ